MYFNLDRQKKQKILNNYKKELLEHQRKKQEAKKLKIQEERNFLIETEIKQQQSEEKILQEQNRKKKALMQEYLDMIKKTKNYLPGYHFQPKNKEVIINNWGKSKEEFYKDNYINNNFHTINHVYNNNLYDVNRFNNLSEIEKVRQIIKPVDSMNKFLTDEQNENEVKSYFLKRKQNKENYYKNLFFSQHNDSVKKNINLYGTDDILILKQKKKKLLTENPYRQKSENRFSNSYLENNPILNPENNMRYNKYFKELYPDISTEKAHNRNFSINYDKNTENSNNAQNNLINVEIYDNNNYKYNNNDLSEYNINNNYKNNYMNENVENNMAKNGNNIINNFNNNKGLYYSYINNNANLRNNSRLTRNYSDIYNIPRSIRNNYNINVNNNNYNDAFEHRLLNNSKRSMSQEII